MVCVFVNSIACCKSFFSTFVLILGNLNSRHCLMWSHSLRAFSILMNRPRCLNVETSEVAFLYLWRRRGASLTSDSPDELLLESVSLSLDPLLLDSLLSDSQSDRSTKLE